MVNRDTERALTQYDFDQHWAVRGGYAFSQNAVPSTTFNPLVPDSNYHLFAVGGSYTAELLALYLLLSPAADKPAQRALALPQAATSTLAGEDAVRAAAARYRFADRLVTTARGYSYPTAREAALKLMETSYLGAQAFSGADLLHGPMAMIDADLPVIAVVAR